jgi:hypothetical protein
LGVAFTPRKRTARPMKEVEAKAGLETLRRIHDSTVRSSHFRLWAIK